MQKHFFSATAGYWVTLSEPNSETIKKYPLDTIEVPERPSPYAKWEVNKWVDYPAPSELLATEARAKRNQLLAASDWTQVADAPVDQAAWAAYRQALRDITAQAGFPETINWPVAP